MNAVVQQFKERLRYSFRNARWRTSFASLSDWWQRSTSTEEDKATATSQYETKNAFLLPKLPVPALQHTLTRYLEAVEPILKESQFVNTRRIVWEFGSENGVGERLQRSLEKRREIYENWAYNWWLDDMYLNNMAALPINSNPGMVFPLRVFLSMSDMAKFAARIVTSALAFKEKIEKLELPVETVTTNGVSQPLCMAQYGRLFSTYRSPGILKDEQFRSETEFTAARPHIIVACRDQFYVVHITQGVNAEILSENKLASHFYSILNDNSKNLKHLQPVGVMTGLRRDRWAYVRGQLLQDNDNKRILSFIEKCMFIICFDLNELPASFNSKFEYDGGGYRTATRDETNMAHQMIHGGGSNANSANRWFDKTIQIIIGSDGVNGLCYEHSPAEGVAVVNAVETIINSCQDLDKIIIDPQVICVPERLSWNLTPEIENEIQTAKDTIDKNSLDLDFNVFRFNGYGKNFIKTSHCSPDAYIQLALQLAYFRLQGKLCATYESASTRRFRLGRVDCIRAPTIEVLKWVSSMENNASKAQKATFQTSRVGVEKQLQLFDEAIKKQQEITTENITGHGIDIHLLGLKQAAKDQMIQTELFEDEVFTIANQFLLSTSQVSTKLNSFMGYGAVVPNGYGASYNPKDETIIFCLSSFYSSPITNTNRFTESLRDSLHLMKDLLLHRK